MYSFVFLACLAVCDVKTDDGSVAEMVDVIELHHCFDFRGKLAFRQLIFYRWSSYHRRFQVVDTVVVTDDSMCPKRSTSGLYRCRWQDVQGTRKVSALTYRQSKSNVDPEVAEREFLPTHLRQGLKRTDSRNNDRPNSPGGAPVRRTSELTPKPQQLLKF